MVAGPSQAGEGTGVRPSKGRCVCLTVAPRLPRPQVQPVRSTLAHPAQRAASAGPGRLCGHCEDSA